MNNKNENYYGLINGLCLSIENLKINFDGVVQEMNMDEKSAEKYIVSLKLQKYIEKLQNDKKSYMTQLLNGNDVKNEIKELDEKINEAKQKIDTLISI